MLGLSWVYWLLLGCSGGAPCVVIDFCTLSVRYVGYRCRLQVDAAPVYAYADWDYIRQRKQNRENAKRIPYTYQIGDKIMLKNTTSLSMVVLRTKAHTQSQQLMITVLYVSNGVTL